MEWERIDLVKILVVLHNLTYTGAVFSSKRICRVLLENGYKVDVWCYYDGPFKKEFEKIGIIPQIIDDENIYENEILVEKIKGYDLLIANTIIVYAIVEISKNLIPTIWYIREAQNLTYQYFFSDIRRYYAIMRAENIYTVSEYAEKYIVENYNPHVHVIHNCVEDEAIEYVKSLQKKNEIIKFLALGTLEERKQFDVFINAYIDLTDEERSQCEVHFAGNIWDDHFEYATMLLELTEKQSGVFYHGEIQERKDLLQLIEDCDVIVVPSKDESCSLVVLEAAMMSKPLIISENIGAKYIVTPNNGWIFETGNTIQLKQIYRDVLKKKQHLKTMGNHSRKIYLQTSTYEVYKRNILNMVSDNLVSSKDQYQMMHMQKAEIEKNQRLNEKRIKYSFRGITFLPEKKIAIYGAGDVGREFYQCCKILNYEVVAWVDKNWKNIHNLWKDMIQVVDINNLKNISFDYVCIAIYKKEIVDEIKKEILRLGIDPEKIIWVRP